jgi:nucleoid-associated protein YgaU
VYTGETDIHIKQEHSMKRILTLAIALGFVVALTGCQLFQKKQETQSMETDATVLAPDTSVEEAPQPQYTEPAPAPGGRIHVVQPKDSIYSLARQYYGDMHQWRKIWQANQDQIPDPDKIKIGQKLIIPE